MGKRLIFQDRVYGEIEFAEPVLEELIRTIPMERLKGVRQGGPVYYIDKRYDVTRFEHSLGVCYLLHRFGASIEEQVAGLLHDVSHTAFSHVADYVFPNKRYEFHDEFFERVVRDSEIPKILYDYGLDLEKVLRRENFHLLDADLPDLSADRLDYSFRDLQNYGLFSQKDSLAMLDSLEVRDEKFVFRDAQAAKDYAVKFMMGDVVLWRHPSSAMVFDLMANAIRRAFEVGVMKVHDFYGVDDEIFGLLLGQHDPVIKENVQSIQSGSCYSFAQKEEAEKEVPAKIRFVDPPVIALKGDLKRLSEADPTMKEWFAFYAAQPKNVLIKRVSYKL